MLSESEKKILSETISSSVDAKKIYIFGSHAYGAPDENSDVDICIVTREKKMRKIEQMRLVRSALLKKMTRAFDILVYDEDDFMERSNLSITLENKISTDGIVIYG